MRKGWIGVDLDGTLAYYDLWRGPYHIGEPIPVMLERVKRWLSEGCDVRIFTARVSATIVEGEIHHDVNVVERHIQLWCEKHLGRALPVTCAKDFDMIELWDDRCIQVIPNTGKTLADEFEAVRSALAGKAAAPPSAGDHIADVDQRGSPNSQ
jgi:hypothetical protein